MSQTGHQPSRADRRDRAEKRALKQEIKSANKASALPRGWQLLTASWRQYRANWRMFTAIAAIVTLPTTAISLIPGAVSDSAFETYSLLFGIAMNAALIYAAVRLLRDDARSTVREAYYDGSALIVRCTLVALALGLMLLPVGIANWLYFVVGYSDLPSELAPVILSGLALITVLLFIPTAWFLTRFFAGLYICAWEDLRPMAALRRGRALTLGRFWKTIGRLAVGALIGLLILFLTALIAIPIGMINPETGPEALFNLVFSIFVLPVGIVFLLNLYRALAGDSVATE